MGLVTRQNTLCAGCALPIVDRFYLFAVERHWHTSCLKCSHCKVQLDSELTCFARDGHIYCKEDYFRLFSVKRCARCCQGIFASELVMRARDLVYHIHCFTCAWCNVTLSQGDYFGLRDHLVYCRTHYEMIAGGDPPTEMPPSDFFITAEGAYPPSPPHSPYLRPSPLLQPTVPPNNRKGRPRKRKNQLDVDPSLSVIHGNGGGIGAPNGGGSDCSGMDSDPMSGGGGTTTPLGGGNPLDQNSVSSVQAQQRAKRMRTSFKHHQLRTMKSYFSVNQNPDAKDLKQLAQKTGLSKRVLQVWFQNARAKWRRNNLRAHDPSLGPLVTQAPLPMVQAQSPGGTRLDENFSSFSEASPSGANSSSGGLDSSNPHNIYTAPNSVGSTTPLASAMESFQELF